MTDKEIKALKEMAHNKRGEYLELLKKGPPPEYRWEAWNAWLEDCCKVKIDKSKEYKEWI